MNFRRLIGRGLLAISALAVGGVSALAMAGLLPGMGGFSNGNVDVDGWRSDFAIGSESANPYTRARVARHGLLALARSEAVYFTRATDSAGRALTESCRYRITGGSMPAQWWSVTLYATGSRLPMNDDGALSFDMSRAGEGEWSAIIASDEPREGNWISSRNAAEFDLTLRLYIPEDALIADPENTLEAPVIERLDCLEAQS